ncbi:MAG TPA: N-acetylmuramoyl-L-alanine amidase [Chthoniobacteraceae bacterium]|jgi:N-acetylmuramoyl-L-alanine amidase|nr:N-acetylmuramoyl-L-alanine amidase [Chthoniobacteraceae bacterium]
MMQARTELRELISRHPMESYAVTRFLSAWLGALLLAVLAAPCAKAGDWDLVRHDGRDYVTIQSLARFYNFPDNVPPVSQMMPASPTEPLTRKLLLDNGRHTIEFTLNDRLAVIDGVNQWLGFPIAAEGDKMIISRLDLVKVIEPTMRPEMITGLGPVDTVVLDPGHGGHDRGAVCIFGNEKDFALDVCLRARKLLEAQGLNVLMTRTDDTFIPLEQRPVTANKTPHSIFVAVHFNDALADPQASGFEIYSITPEGEPSTQDTGYSVRDLRQEPGNVTDVQSLALSESIYHSMLGNIPQVDRGVKHARFAVIRLAQVPSVLIEGGFVSSDTEARQIATPIYRQELAEAIVTGIEGYKTLAEHKVPYKLVAEYRHETAPTGQTAPIVQTSPTVITNATVPATSPAPAASAPPSTQVKALP